MKTLCFRRFADLFSVGLILVLAAYGVFSLPYWFPPSELMRSQAYQLGCNNSIGVFAVLAAVGLLTLRAIFLAGGSPKSLDRLLDFQTDKRQTSPRSMPLSILFFFIAVYLTLQIAVYFCVPTLAYWGETISCLPRLELSWRYHLQLYTEIDWAYGPALFYLPAITIEIGRSLDIAPDISYLACLGLMTVAGLWLLFDVVNCFRINAAIRVVIFSVTAICCCGGSMGVNYTLLRFMLPYAAILFLHRRFASPTVVGRRNTWNACALCFVCALAVLSISTEIGLVYIVAQIIYAIHGGLFGKRFLFWTILATAAAPIIMFLAFPGCFQAMVAFSKGGNTLPLLPGPHILFYLVCLFWIAPIMLKACATRHPQTDTPLWLAWIAMALMCVAPALGRCDFGHVLFNGLGIFLMTFVVLWRYKPRWLPAYAASMVMLFGIVASTLSAVYASNDGNQYTQILATLSGSPKVLNPKPARLVSELGLEKYEKIAIPYGIDYGTRKWLIDTGRFLPQFHPDYVNVTSQADLNKKQKQLSMADAVLLPEPLVGIGGLNDHQFHNATIRQAIVEENRNALLVSVLLCCPVSFKVQQVPLIPALEEARYITSHFTFRGKFGGWALFVK
ncbi:MAG: hypothetical protein ABFC54_09200 [Thermoguttaceae bacterium]